MDTIAMSKKDKLIKRPGVELGPQGAVVELREAEAALLEALCGARRDADQIPHPLRAADVHALCPQR